MDNGREQNERDDVIRLTREEAMGDHVEDLLRRQRSMRGEPGITLDRKGPWFYQNWFVFGLAGMLAALFMWAVFEPYYNDYLYIQGPVENLNLEEPLFAGNGFEFIQPDLGGKGWIQVRGEKIWLFSNTRGISNGETRYLRPEQLGMSSEVGAYVEYLEIPNGTGLALAHFIDLTPSTPPPSRALQSFSSQERRQGCIRFYSVSMSGRVHRTCRGCGRRTGMPPATTSHTRRFDRIFSRAGGWNRFSDPFKHPL